VRRVHLTTADGSPLPVGSRVGVCVQPHRVSLAPASGQSSLTARVVRVAYLGETRDYVLELAGGLRIRVVTPAIEPGSEVAIVFPPEACHVVSAPPAEAVVPA
jgi:hypothetical protein